MVTAAAAEAGPESEAQVEAVRALGELGPAGLPFLERIAKRAERFA